MFTSIWTIVDGALNQELDIPDGADAQAALDRFVLDAELAAKSDGQETLVYIMPHYHALDDTDECVCASWLTDHTPEYTFN